MTQPAYSAPVPSDDAELRRLALIGRLATRFSHQIGNAVGVIATTADLVKRAPTTESVDAIVTSAADATALCIALRELLRVEGGPAIVDVNAVVTRTAEALDRLFAPRIRVSAELDSTCAEVRVDAGELRRAIADLVLRTETHMTEEGAVRIHTLARGDRVTIVVIASHAEEGNELAIEDGVVRPPAM
jgi:signal transduction histidine kinase